MAKENKTMDQIHRGLLKKFHTLCSVLGLAEDKLRKQLIAAIGCWLRETSQEQNISKIKGIACRASGYSDFNKIPRERLRNLIAAFNNKTKDIKNVDALTGALLMQTLGGGKVTNPVLN